MDRAQAIPDPDAERLLAACLTDAEFPELPNFSRGKVRDMYDLADGRRIMVATDRQSAFDEVLAAVPLKGQVLNQTAQFWFEKTADICPNHVVDFPDPNVIVGRCTSWSRQGLLLLGDAAHPMAPIRAQGINLALRDVIVPQTIWSPS